MSEHKAKALIGKKGYNPIQFKGKEEETKQTIKIKKRLKLVCEQDGEEFEADNYYYPAPICPKCGCSGMLRII